MPANNDERQAKSALKSMTILCYQVLNYWLSVLGLFFNELVNDFITNFILAVSFFVLHCLRTLKENLAQ